MAVCAMGLSTLVIVTDMRSVTGGFARSAAKTAQDFGVLCLSICNLIPPSTLLEK
ncbi:hypothetical protein FHS27_000084 [Rhodopirellula rubra]|uniref:Uncharacterized protein n=1 Tax=Aporhodopirellula rubra TaxID=980271 RepID=A0A7W5DTY6_9BACT|nr:hypothetical protein [Aporhodopirellula rubra]